MILSITAKKVIVVGPIIFRYFHLHIDVFDVPTFRKIFQCLEGFKGFKHIWDNFERVSVVFNSFFKGIKYQVFIVSYQN